MSEQFKILTGASLSSTVINFNETNPTLRSLQSGMVASDQLIADFETAYVDAYAVVH